MSDASSPPPSRGDTAPAAVIALSGDYTLREEIGRGASGTVFRAELRRGAHGLPAGAEVAIKFLRREFANDPAAAERLRREGELGMRISSPFIAKIHGVIHEDVLGLTFVGLVMELVRGPTIRRFLRERGPAVDDLVRRIGEDAALGLQALHDDNLVHRDVKPENMALTPEGRVKLMDLGLAWAGGTSGGGRGSSPGGSAGFFGSIAYAAPEVLKGRPATGKSDLYALGVVLYELLTGKHPFAELLHDADQLLQAHLEREPQRPAHANARVSPFLESVVLDLLRKEPLLRGFDAASLAATLAEGERSEYWLERVREAPVRAAQRRLRGVRRFAPTAFFGRRGELQQLHRRLRLVLRSGTGTAVRITGPEGIGRRRLLDEWLEEALEEHGARLEFVAGSGDQDPTRPRGTPFPEMLLELLLDGDRADAPNAQERAAQRLRSYGGGLSEGDIEQLAKLCTGHVLNLLPAARADLLARGLLAAAQASDRALVIRVDRADHLDTTAQLVVETLLRQVERHRLLLVLVMHLRHAKEPFAHHHLNIKGLEPADFAACAKAMFAADAQPTDEQVEAACAALGGSPGALIESLDELAQQGTLRGQPGAWHGLPPDAELRPAGPLLARVRQRAKELAPEARFVLQTAAVLGERFPLRDLVELCGQPELQVLAALSVFQGRVIKADEDEVEFRHRDFRMVLLDLVPRAQRRSLHRDAAWVLERRGASALEVGMHMSRAMEHAAAVPLLLQGLEQLVAAGSRRAANRVLARLRAHVVAAPDTPARARLRLLQLAAAVAHSNGELDAAGTALTESLALAEQLGDAQARARSLLHLAQLASDRNQPQAALGNLDLASAAAASVPARSRGRLAADVAIARAEVELELGRAEAASASLQRAREALGSAAARHATLRLAEANVQLVRSHWVRADKALAVALRSFAEAGDRHGMMRAHATGVALAAQVNDAARAEQQLAAVRALAERVAEPRVLSRATLAMAELHTWLGDLAAARPLLLDALAQAHACADVVGREIAALWLRLLGIPVPRPPREATLADAPVVRALRCIAELKHSRSPGGETAAPARELLAQFDLPLHVHLLLLRALGDGERAEQIREDVVARLPRRERRGFEKLTASAARLVAQRA